MNNIEILFFELIRVSTGNQVCLTHTPSVTEWQMLFDMALKQSLLGICFVGVQKLQTQEQCPSEMLYLQWMGMAAKIQQKNEVVNQQCSELQAKLSACGLKACVLKGQGVANLYSEHLRILRQSGDIDVWVKADPKYIIDFAKSFVISEDPTYLHVGAKVFEDTQVELHWRPTFLEM